MASSHPVVIRENWETYSYVSDGGQCFTQLSTPAQYRQRGLSVLRV